MIEALTVDRQYSPQKKFPFPSRKLFGTPASRTGPAGPRHRRRRRSQDRGPNECAHHGWRPQDRGPDGRPGRHGDGLARPEATGGRVPAAARGRVPAGAGRRSPSSPPPRGRPGPAGRTANFRMISGREESASSPQGRVCLRTDQRRVLTGGPRIPSLWRQRIRDVPVRHPRADPRADPRAHRRGRRSPKRASPPTCATA